MLTNFRAVRRKPEAAHLFSVYLLVGSFLRFYRHTASAKQIITRVDRLFPQWFNHQSERFCSKVLEQRGLWEAESLLCEWECVYVLVAGDELLIMSVIVYNTGSLHCGVIFSFQHPACK